MLRRHRTERIASVAALDDPTRRALFDFVAGSQTAVTREAAAESLGISRRIAAFHLDRLAELGLLSVEYRRTHGRTGPGAGRPAKLYRRSDAEFAVSVPERHYEFVGALLAAAVSESIATGAAVPDVLDRTAYDAGRSIGATAGDMRTALSESGYEPSEDSDGTLVLRNCPFHRLADRYADLVCGVNLQLVRGVAAGCGDDARTAVLDPGPGRCCVRVAANDPGPTNR
jgi:predicted ArsR family transcriptional regulator